MKTTPFVGGSVPPDVRLVQQAFGHAVQEQRPAVNGGIVPHGTVGHGHRGLVPIHIKSTSFSFGRTVAIKIATVHIHHPTHRHRHRPTAPRRFTLGIVHRIVPKHAVAQYLLVVGTCGR